MTAPRLAGVLRRLATAVTSALVFALLLATPGQAVALGSLERSAPGAGPAYAGPSTNERDYAVTFNGTTQYASASSTVFDLADAVSVSAWVRLDSLPTTGTQDIVFKNRAYSLRIYEGKWSGVVADDSSASVVTGGQVTLGWTHVALTWIKGGSPTLYVNGQVAAAGTAFSSSLSTTATDTVTVGLWIFGGAFPVVIDDVRLWSDVRTQAEIQTDMHTYGPILTNGSPTPNLIAYYDFNAGSGTSAPNMVSGASSATHLSFTSSLTWSDVKTTTTVGTDTVVTFPRSYITAAGGWRVPEGVTQARYLVVGGGGGGGVWVGSGGGAGEVRKGTLTGLESQAYPVVVAAGGLGGRQVGAGTTTFAHDGQASTFASITAGPGGGGRSWGEPVRAQVAGSTGGGSSSDSYRAAALTTTTPVTSGDAQRFASLGGAGLAGTTGVVGAQEYPTGGGGGASQPGFDGTSSGSGSGGAGVTDDITGSTLTYGGGGGGGVHGPGGAITKLVGAGGAGGGGAGAGPTGTTGTAAIAQATPGTPNTGGGGGGAGAPVNANSAFASYGGSGGSGVVIVRYALPGSFVAQPAPTRPELIGSTSSCATPPSAAWVGQDILLTFTNGACDWTVPVGVTSLRVVAVGGGGGGGADGGTGGGGGALVESAAVAVSPSQPVRVSVGAGGSGSIHGGAAATQGGTSAVRVPATAGSDTIWAGGGWPGGGFLSRVGAAAAGTTTGLGGSDSGGGTSSTGGTGGAGADDGGGTTLKAGGVGLAGATTSISGSSIAYGGGGGGGISGLDFASRTNAIDTTGPSGGTGGGGSGANYTQASGGTDGFPGQVNSGGGGGGGAAYGGGFGVGERTDGGAGGSGIVLIRYTPLPECTPLTYGSGNFTVVEFQDVTTCLWFPPSAVTSVDALIVGGGGGGGSARQSSDHLEAGSGGGGGGGGGGVLSQSGHVITAGAGVVVTVGAGGSGGAQVTTGSPNPGTAGGQSALGSLSASGGGAGLAGTTGSQDDTAGDGGSSSLTVNGVANSSYTPGTSVWEGGGGGEGAGGSGANGTDIPTTGGNGGAGGAGYFSDITGASTYYGGGGGGGGFAPGTGAVGGVGGGGAAALLPGTSAQPGVDGLGGGGGGGGYTNGTASTAGGAGGDGIVIVRYATKTMSLTAGNNQTVARSSAVPVNPRVKVIDAEGVGVDGVQVTFAVTSGGGSVGTSTVTTSGGGFAETTWTLGSTIGNQTLTATGSGVGSGSITITATAAGSRCDVDFNELNFDYSKAINITGNGKSVGNKVLFQDVLPSTRCGGVDALVTTSSIVNASIVNYEAGARAGGANSYFQADVDITANNGYAEFEFTFFEANTYGTVNVVPVTMENVKITAIDIDYYQSNYISNFNSYTLARDTRITTSPVPSSFPASALFQGSSSIGENSPRDQVVVTYASVDQFSIRFSRSTKGSPNYYGVAFKELGWGTSTPSTTGTQYTLSYDGNGGTGSVPASVTAPAGTEVTVSSTTLTKSGSVFLGWNTKADGSGVSYAAASKISMPLNGVTLYAQWSVVTYSVSYNANGATGGSVPASQSATAGATVTVRDNTGTLTRSGYTLSGWSQSPSGGTTLPLASGTLTMPGSNVTLYAVWTPASQPITYNANTGSLNPACTSTSGTAPASPTAGNTGASIAIPGNTGSFACGGYVFTGWNTAANGTGTDYAPGATVVMPVGGLALYAQWERLFFLTYNANGGAGAPAPTSGTAGTTVTVTSGGGLTRAGYSFAGWNTSANGSGTTLGTRYTMPADNVTVYAMWTADEQVISYNANGGSSAPGSQASSTGASYTIVNGVPVRPGYTFTAWNTKADGSGTAYASGNTLTVGIDDVVLYAQWTPVPYALTYSANGAEAGTVPGSLVRFVGETATVSSTNLAWRGYTFNGWNTAADGSGTHYSATAVLTMPALDVTLFAQWSANPFVIRYNGNGATSGTGPTAGTAFVDQVRTTAATAGSWLRTGFTFAGWARTTSGEAPSSPGSTFVMPASDVTWFAQWTPNTRTVAYDANTGDPSSVPAVEQALFGSTVLVPAAVPTKEGHWFNGWNTASNGSGTAHSASGSFTMPNSNVTLYAQWVANSVTLAYHGNGATGGSVPSAQTVAFGSGVTTANNTGSLTRAGYTLAGWSQSATGAATYTLNQSNAFSMPNSTVTLYAIWTPVNQTLTYDGNAGADVVGSLAAADNAVPTDSHVSVSPTIPTRNGYTFAGWNTAADGSGDPYIGGDSFLMPASNVTLYAQWVADTFVVTYSPNGGQGGPESALKATASTVTVSVDVPERSGHTFAGWNTAADGSGSSYVIIPPGSFSMPPSNVTLYAQWTPIPYTLSYDANGGSGAPASATGLFVDQIVMLDSVTVPTRTGYTFIGWAVQRQAFGAMRAAGGSLVMPASDLTLYAQWVGNSFDIEFDLNDGQGGPAGFAALAGLDVTIPGTAPSRTDYTFRFWRDALTGDRVDPNAVFAMPDRVLRLVAEWEYTPPPAPRPVVPPAPPEGPVTPQPPTEPVKPVFPPLLQPTVGTTTAGSTVTITPLSDDRFREGSVRLINPKTGEAVTRLTTSQGTFRVNTTTGVITFTPKRGFTGIAQAPVRAVTADGQEQRSTVTVVVQSAGAKKIRSISRTVYFASMSPRLDATDRKILRNLVRLVNSRGTETKGLVVGFVQPVGGVYNDFSLSTARARSVKAFLESLGVKTIRTANGLGRAKEPDGKARRATVTLYYVPSGS